MLKLPKLLGLYAFMLFAIQAIAQPTGKSAKYFLPKNIMTTGVYYYPEAWPENQWERDMKNIAALGFEYVHMGEFAWAFMEPTEGNYQWAWLDKNIALAEKNGMKVLLCTPSPCPPAWLLEKYPDVAMVNDYGTRLVHGTRTHGSFSSQKYRELVAGIVTQLAKRYGKDKRVIGWQLDNEPSHYGKYEFGQEAQENFRLWLQKKHGTIDALNKAWGNAFWSQNYNSFAQIRIPNPRELVHGWNPHAILDHQRFFADECAAFLSAQNETLRKFIAPEQFVTTNFMSFHPPTDPRRNKDLDFITYTMYPVHGGTPKGEIGFRLGDPYKIAWANDFYRSISGNTGIMEIQPGQVNWGETNTQPLPGAVRMWLFNALMGGCDLACTYRYRQPLFGSEQYHYGIVGTDGVTPSQGGLEFKQVMAEVKQLRKDWKDSKMPADMAARKVGFLYNLDNVYETSNQKQTGQWDFQRHMLNYYGALKQLTCPVDFLDEDFNFKQYPIVIAPAYQLLDAGLVSKWTDYVQNGGHLVLSCRTGQKNRMGHLWEGPYQMPILNLIGAKIPMFDLIPNSVFGKIETSGKSYDWNNWGDILEPNPGTESWSTYTTQFYAGKSAVTHRKLGKGTVTYIGVDSEDGQLELDIIKKLFETVKIPYRQVPYGVNMQWREGFYFATNVYSTPAQLPVPANTKFIIGSSTLKPADVAVWKE